MGRRHKPEEIIGKLREAEIVLAQGGTVADACRRIGVTEQNPAVTCLCYPATPNRAARGALTWHQPINWRGLSKRRISPISVTNVTGTMSSTPRSA
jgi:hypothetical protein